MTEPRRAPRGERRRRILTSGNELFAAQGFASTTLEQIASRAKVSLAQLQQSFDSPAEILRTLLAEMVEALSEELSSLDPEHDPIGYLHSLTAQAFALRQSHAYTCRAFLRLTTESTPESIELVNGFVQSVCELGLPVIIFGQQTGLFRRSLHPTTVMRQWLNGVVGALVLHADASAQTVAGGHVTATLECFLRGLVKIDV